MHPLQIPQNLLHLPALCQFIHELIQVPHFPGQRVLDVLDPVPADDAGNQRSIRVQGSVLEELVKGDLLVNVLLQRSGIEAGQPLDDLVKFLFGAAFPLYFGQVHRVYRSEGHFGDAVVMCGGGVHRGYNVNKSVFSEASQAGVVI